MRRLIKSELFQLCKSESYKSLFIICCVTALSPVKQQMMGRTDVTGYEWFCVDQLMGGMVLIPVCIFTADYVAAGFSDHVFAMSVCSGFRRGEGFGAKLIVYLAGVMSLFLGNTVTGTVSRSIQYGFGTVLDSIALIQMAKAFGYYILTYPLIISMSFFFWAVAAKSRIGSIGFGIISVQLLGAVTSKIGFRFPLLFQWNPLYQIHSLIKPQTFHQIPFHQFVIASATWFLVLLLLSGRLFYHSDF